MKPIQGYDLVAEAGDIKPIPASIQGVRITKVVDNPANEYLEIYCDIVKGEYKDYFKTLTSLGLKDTSRTFRSYKANALPFFKAFITAIEKTNPGYRWDWDEQKLVGKNVMAVFGEEEYIDNEGNLKVVTKIQDFRSLEAYQQGRITVPSIKRLSEEEKSRQIAAVQSSKPAVVDEESVNTDKLEIPDDELPF